MISRVPGLRQVPLLFGRPGRSTTALFDSWTGRYADNPRAISEELRRRDQGLEHVWVLDQEASKLAPDWVKPVTRNSVQHLACLGNCDYVVADSTVSGFYRKRANTTFLQTWHGTPLKKIGFDLNVPPSRTARRYERTLRRNAEQWDFLISPNAFSTPILRRAFDYAGAILEIGYPRNDFLLRPDANDIRARVRGRLGIKDSQSAVLYAPTFRDGKAFSVGPELERLAAALGDSHVILLRAHDVDASAASASPHGGLRDVSSHPEVAELYLAADVLVTDYSSVMFDYAVTGKPILFFTYDLEEYRDTLRGFYFDFERDSPGPLLRTTAALEEALLRIDEVSERYAGAFEAFRQRFCDLEDGAATGRAVDALLSNAKAN